MKATSKLIKLPGLKRSRVSKKITRIGLSKKAGVSTCTTYVLETLQKPVSIKTAEKLAKALGVTLTTLRTA